MENKKTNQEPKTQIISDSQLLNLKLDKILEILNVIYQKAFSIEEKKEEKKEERAGVFKPK
jgi:hypothetical protein